MMFIDEINIADIWIIIFMLFGFVQFLAFVEGIRVMLDFNFLVGALAFFVVGMIPAIGGLVVVYVGFVGAVRGWRLSWWVAIMIVWPGLVWAISGYTATGIHALIERLGI